jgi:hypothetical protein
MQEKRLVPVPYYYIGPLAKVKAPTTLPHPLGYIPKYLRKEVNRELRSST